MAAKLFEVALGITAPWTVATVEFDESAKVLTVRIDFGANTSNVASLTTRLFPPSTGSATVPPPASRNCRIASASTRTGVLRGPG